MSTTKVAEVKTKGKVVATLEIVQYETLEEARENIEDSKILACLNRMLVTDATNAERAKHRPGTAGKAKRRNLAIQAAFNSPDYKDKLIELMGGGDDVALGNFLDSDEIQELVNAALETDD